MKLAVKQTREFRQEQRFSQKQLFELNVLALSCDELNEWVSQELEQNPFLEVDDQYYIKGKNIDLLINYINKNETLQEVLMNQVRLNDAEINIERIEYLVSCLDSNGYLQLDEKEMQQFLSCSKEEIDESILDLQCLEPHGVGARNLKECLTLQLIYAESNWSSLAMAIVENHLELLASYKIDKLKEILKQDRDSIYQAIRLIRSLDPKPGAQYATLANYIEPDLIILQDEDGLELELKDKQIYHLILNTEYTKDEDPEFCQYRKEYTKRAQDLIRSITRRCSTLLNVASEIVLIQKEYFLNHGSLKPMTLAMLAERLNLNESTVSRCIKDKYVEIDGKLMEIKDLFTTALASGESNSEIMQRLHTMIHQEDKTKPLSDQEMVDCLKKEGIQISRSAIAKYRKIMKIPSTIDRKRQ